VHGRVNDLPFSPVGPHLAIGTGSGRVALWNFETAETDRKWGKFDHSIGQVAFAETGQLVCGERSNRRTGCSLYACLDDGSATCLAKHERSITAAEPAGDSLVLVADRDRYVTLWDTADGKQIRRKELADWARWARVSPNGEWAALLHKGVQLISLADMKTVCRTLRYRWHGVSSEVAFSPEGDALIVGRFRQDVTVCRIEQNQLVPEKDSFVRHAGLIRGVEIMPNHPIVVTLSSDGQIQLTSWPGRTVISKQHTTGEKPTSLRISPDGSFMAIGHADASMNLWDLRAMDVAAMVARPLAKAGLHDLAILALLTEGDSLPRPVRDALLFIQRLVKYRCRYEIEIAETLPTIRVGEFDIEIEG